MINENNMTNEQAKQLIAGFLVHPNKVISLHANGILKQLNKVPEQKKQLQPLPEFGDTDFLC